MEEPRIQIGEDEVTQFSNSRKLLPTLGWKDKERKQSPGSGSHSTRWEHSGAGRWEPETQLLPETLLEVRDEEETPWLLSPSSGLPQHLSLADPSQKLQIQVGFGVSSAVI